jgi:hypothetical protein
VQTLDDGACDDDCHNQNDSERERIKRVLKLLFIYKIRLLICSKIPYGLYAGQNA